MVGNGTSYIAHDQDCNAKRHLALMLSQVDVLEITRQVAMTHQISALYDTVHII